MCALFLLGEFDDWLFLSSACPVQKTNDNWIRMFVRLHHLPLWMHHFRVLLRSTYSTLVSTVKFKCNTRQYLVWSIYQVHVYTYVWHIYTVLLVYFVHFTSDIDTNRRFLLCFFSAYPNSTTALQQLVLLITAFAGKQQSPKSCALLSRNMDVPGL